MAERQLISRQLFIVGRFILLIVVALLLGSAIGLSVVFFRDGDNLYAIGSLVVGLFSATALLSLAALISLLYRVLEHQDGQVGTWSILQEDLRRQEALLQQISENVLISDAAKGVVYRNRDRELMNNAIQEDIANKDWEAAYQLLEQMQSRFGYSQEAADFRRLVDSERAKAIQAVIEQTRQQVDNLCATFNWSEAQTLLDGLAKQFPHQPEVLRMAEQTVGQRQAEHKKRLLASWEEAVQNGEVDRGIELLRQLDQYLTSSEAAALAESARGVFKAKLQNLGVKFSIAVTEKNWSGALEVGRQIVSEFPNSRMAEEVKGKLDILTQRAQQQAGV
ncbi:MAG: hypothetical protein GWP14_09105 [Actinobacteria bacterium]|nr:hypothetical protein [Actinomycetota bacterium]